MIINFDELRNEIDESIEKVNESFFDIIDKNEMIQENSDFSDVLADLFMESLYIFMESKNRERDRTPRNEIAKWMDKKGYWYQGDNNKKKKECNRMYHFLQQHKFNPKDETYETEIKDKDGKNKRMKLIIDPDTISKMDREYVQKENLFASSDRNRAENIAGALRSEEAVRKGENAYFTRGVNNNNVTIGSKILKGKQIDAQGILKHEEGHAYSWNNRKDQNSMTSLYDNPDNAKEAKKALDDHKNSGKYVNKHDDSTEELMADLYMAMHAKVRTKNWGKNKETRSFNKKDIEIFFNKLINQLDHMYTNIISGKEIINENNRDKQLAQIKKEVESMCNDFNKFNTDNQKNLADMAKSLFNRISAQMNSTFAKLFINKAFYKSNSSYDYNDVRKNFEEFSKIENNIKDKMKTIDSIQNTLKNVKDIYNNHGIKDNKDILHRVSNDITGDDKLSFAKKMAILHAFIDCTTYTDLCQSLENLCKTEMETCQLLEKDLDCIDNALGNEDKLGINKIITSADKEYQKTHKIPDNFVNDITKKVSDWYNERIEKNAIRIIKCNKQCYEELEKRKKEIKESHELRMKFAQTAVKEYFEELFDDDFYYD
jgi:hypothetical protein